MRTRSIITATLVAATSALAAPAAGGAVAKAERVTKVTTKIELFAQGAPNPSGIHFGFVRSPRPLGSGVHYNAYTVTPTGMGRGSVAGTFKNYYARGTTRGTFTQTFVAANPVNITYDGTIKITGGTGAFRRVAGSGTIHCTSADGGAHKSCTVQATLTGL